MSQIAAGSAGSEIVLGVIGGVTRASGLLGAKQTRGTLILTDQRVIFAEIGKDRVIQLTRDAGETARDEGRGVVGRMSARSHALDGIADTYRTMAPAAALAESPGNLAIDRSTIRRVKTKRGAAEESVPDRIVIKAADGKHTFHVGGALRSAKEALAAAGLI
ncbi:MAG: hypothetical protein KDA98_03875 [Acidimicrobiales bacterium]|nr:hypothetical protein [Acidimicrobiales bacterium]